MIRQLFAVLVVVGACIAFPHEDKSIAGPPSGPMNPDRGPADPETYFDPERPFHGRDLNPPVPLVDPEMGPLPEENEPVTTEVPDLQGGPKPDKSDLKTDATFWPYSYSSWWSYPSYRTSWSYPTYYYRSYWNYPQYRHYSPRSYYSNYYW